MVKVLIPSPSGLACQANSGPQHIADDDDNEWEVIAEYATNHQLEQVGQSSTSIQGVAGELRR